MASITITMQRRDRPAVAARTTKRSFVVGASGAEADVVLADDPGVRMAHVRVIVRRTDLAIILRPFPAADIHVNGVQVTEPVQLIASDVVRLGDTEVRFEVEGEPTGRRWWNPAEWGRGDDEAPQAPGRVSANPPAQLDPELPPPPPPPELPRRPTMPLPMPVGNPPFPMPMPTYNPPPPSPPLPLPAPRWRDRLAADPTEHALLAAIRDAPNDPLPRMVYADWLETAGRAAAAAAARGDRSRDILAITDIVWRANVTHAPVRECNRTECPGQWTQLLGTRDETCRSCPTCQRAVYFAASEVDCEAMGQHGLPYAPDISIGDGSPSAYARGRHRH